MNQSMYDLVMHSKHVSTATRGKALSLLNSSSRKRSRADVEGATQRESSSFMAQDPNRSSMAGPDSLLQENSQARPPTDKRRRTMGPAEIRRALEES